MNKTYIGWDIGGAHLKMVALDQQANILQVQQLETPLWKGLEVLKQAIKSLPASLFSNAIHGLTMTGELADIFPHRVQGVRDLITLFTEHFSGNVIRIYAGEMGWLEQHAIAGNESCVASANWHATANYAARKIPSALMVDTGSTTTDIIPLINGRPEPCGFTDNERMKTDELLYTGVIRTPVSMLVDKIPLHGEWQQIARELFASMGDVYILTGDLGNNQPDFATFSTADGQGVQVRDCARRLARIAGCDLDDEEIVVWKQLAAYIARRHANQISDGISRVISRYPDQTLPIIGAGAGRFLIRRLAQWHNYPYHDFADLLQGEERLKQAAAVCAPATACASLLIP